MKFDDINLNDDKTAPKIGDLDFDLDGKDKTAGSGFSFGGGWGGGWGSSGGGGGNSWGFGGSGAAETKPEDNADDGWGFSNSNSKKKKAGGFDFGLDDGFGSGEPKVEDKPPVDEDPWASIAPVGGESIAVIRAFVSRRGPARGVAQQSS